VHIHTRLLRRGRLGLAALAGTLVAAAVGVPAAFAGERPACADTGTGAHCFALVTTTATGADAALATPSIVTAGPPFGPADFHAAYNLPATAPVAQTIAIVDAFDDPNAESDLAVFSSTFGLPPCTTANGCFKKVNQNGGSAPPPSNVGWALEISLDVDTAHGICPNCRILLVEANDNSFTNLAKAVNRAAVMGATEISNSYGGSEFGDSFSAYNHKNIAITVSSGDGGFSAGTQFPASAPSVIAVGGTSLHVHADGTYSSESAWSGAGSGCSAFYLPKSFQASNVQWQNECPGGGRGVADVSADADPSTGAYVYDTFGEPGWLQVGGTSLSAPLIAGVYALAGNAASAQYPAKLPYKHKGQLHDVTTGSNGSCGGGRICTAKTGLDGPTGLGTPRGLGGF
jgi:subtilase family serine protease